MSDLLLPGDERADGVLDDAALLTALATVEEAWSQTLTDAGLVPAAAALAPGTLRGLLHDGDAADVARAAEASGNAVVPLVALWRNRLRQAGQGDASTWLHRGLTSQDALDTALVLTLRDAAARVLADLRSQARVLRDLAVRHRDDVQAARTLTQHAVPTTFGLVASGWLHAVLDAEAALQAARGALPAQVGGAAGTLAAVAELGGGGEVGAHAAVAAGAALADRLGLPPAPPWHVRRGPLTALADALATATAAQGKIAGDVLLRSRPEVGELREPSPGGSSTMPHKANPVLSVLVRRAALLAPGYAAVLHTAAALADDERPAGAWHAEWPTLRAVARTAVVAASQTVELLSGLVVDVDRMRTTARGAAADLLAEQRSVRGLQGEPDAPGQLAVAAVEEYEALVDELLSSYLGAAGPLVDAAVARADARLAEFAPAAGAAA